MNKKFLSAILFGALVASTGSFVSCADNDDDIKQLQDQNGELKAQLAQLKSELQAELKNAASAAQVAALEAKLSAIDGVSADNIAAVVAALKGDFKDEAAKVAALEMQVAALKGLEGIDASELIAVIEKAKENGNADMGSLSAMVDEIAAEANVLYSALRGLVFQPDFYVDGIEATEYEYLKYVPLSPKGDVFTLPEAYSNESSITGDKYLSLTEIAEYNHYIGKAKIAKDFVWGYAHTGNILYAVQPEWNFSSWNLWSWDWSNPENIYNYWDWTYVKEYNTNLHYDTNNDGQMNWDDKDQCLATFKDGGIFVAEDPKDKNPIKVESKNILNTMRFAVNPSNAKVTKEDLAFVVKNICAMTRANEASITINDAVVKDGILTVEYWVNDWQKIITANNDESYSVLNQKENTTIVKLQSATATENGVESDWAALYETSIQPVAVALNKNSLSAHADEKDSKWVAPIRCARDYNADGEYSVIPDELHKNPYEAISWDKRTAAIEYDSKGVDIAKHVELHFVKRDEEKTDRVHQHEYGWYNHDKEVKCPHITMTLEEAAHRFGFTYEFKLVPFIVDDNETNNSSYAHLKNGLYENSVIVPNTVDEEQAKVLADPFAYIPKAAVDAKKPSADGYEQGVSSVDKEPLVQILVKKDGHVILDAYASFIITRNVANIISPVFDLGAKDRDCTLSFAQTWNQVSELLYEQTAGNKMGMSKLEFEETYELATYAQDTNEGDPNDKYYRYTGYSNWKYLAKQYTNLKFNEDGTVASYSEIDFEDTYAQVIQNIDLNGINNTVLEVYLDKYDQQYVLEKKGGKDDIYVMYKRRGAHTSESGIFVPLHYEINAVVSGIVGDKDVNFWYAADGTVNIEPDDAIRLNVNYAKDGGNTYKESELAYLNEEKIGFVRDLDDAWMGKTVVFKNAKGDVLDKIDTEGNVYNAKNELIGSERARYYFHPYTNNVVITDPVSGEKIYLSVGSDEAFCDIWKKGDGEYPSDCDEHSAIYNDKGELVASNVKNHEKIENISSMSLEEFYELERKHQMDTRFGIYKNTKLFAYNMVPDPEKEGEVKPGEKVQIAQLDPVSGHVQYFWIDDTNNIAKRALNALGHAVKENAEGATDKDKVYVGVYRQTCDNNAYAIADNVFPSYFLRPLDILPAKDKEVVDAKNNGDYVTLFDMFNFQDWRDIKFIDGEDYSNVWLLAYYGVNKITVNVKDIKTNLGHPEIASEDVREKGVNLNSVNQDIKISYVEHNKTAEMPSIKDENDKVIKYYKTITMSPYNKASMGVKSTWTKLVEHFGMIKYENKGANVSDFDVVIPVTFGYDWGEINTTVKIHVKGTIANNG